MQNLFEIDEIIATDEKTGKKQIKTIYKPKYKDDAKIIAFCKDNIYTLKSNTYFEHFLVNKVLDVMVNKKLIINFSDLTYNFVRLNLIIKGLLK